MSMRHFKRSIPLPAPALFDTYTAICVFLLILTALVVVVKFRLTWKGKGRLQMDDAMIGAGLVSLIATGVVGAQAYGHGLGKPTVLIGGSYPSWKAFEWEYFYYTVWYLPLYFSKIAFFVKYVNTFTQRWVLLTLRILMGIFTAITIIFIAGTTIMNTGIARSSFDAAKALRYHVQFKYLHYAWGMCDMAADIWICAFPLWGLTVLKMSFRGPARLTAKFCVPLITLILCLVRIVNINLIMSRDVANDHSWDLQLAETVPVLWALVQAGAAVIITTIPSLALCTSIWYKSRYLKMTAPKPAPATALETAKTTANVDAAEAENGEASSLNSGVNRHLSGVPSLETTGSSSFPGSSNLSRLSKAERILGQRLHRTRRQDEYDEETHRLGAISNITVTRTVDVRSALDPEQGFKILYRRYCGME